MSHSMVLRFDSIAAREHYRTAMGISPQGLGRQRVRPWAEKRSLPKNPFGILFAVAFRITVLVANAMLNAFTTANDAGTAAVINGYSGTQATTPETAIGAQVLLFQLTMSATSFPAASSNTITANTISDDSSADATGTLTWFRMLTQSGGTAICDGSAATSSADMIVNTTAITSGSTVSCSSCVLTMPVS